MTLNIFHFICFLLDEYVTINIINKMCHLEESAYSAYVLVPYGSGINYSFSKRVFIKNRQATLKNNFDSLVPSSVVFKKQSWNWKKMYVLLSII